MKHSTIITHQTADHQTYYSDAHTKPMLVNAMSTYIFSSLILSLFKNTRKLPWKIDI